MKVAELTRLVDRMRRAERNVLMRLYVDPSAFDELLEDDEEFADVVGDILSDLRDRELVTFVSGEARTRRGKVVALGHWKPTPLGMQAAKRIERDIAKGGSRAPRG